MNRIDIETGSGNFPLFFIVHGVCNNLMIVTPHLQVSGLPVHTVSLVQSLLVAPGERVPVPKDVILHIFNDVDKWNERKAARDRA